jgi:NlpC/P60 family putative phage cell wall peptidase
MPDRSAVVECARSYLGTPYRHQGRLKGIGLDCIGLALCVGADLGLNDREGKPVHRYMYADYSRQPLGEELQEECARRLVVKSFYPPADLSDVLPGDVLTMRVPSVITHLAIVSELTHGLGMIHSYSGVRKIVVEHLIDQKWARRIAGVFSFPGVE